MLGWSAVGYGSYFGKKLDPEPGRCRRTDGKKWRCSKEAAPDSKYCERHMHRGRNRSRKPVEAQLVAPHSQPPATAPAAAVTSTAFQNHSLYPAIANGGGANGGGGGGGGGGSAPGSFALGSNTQLHMDNAASYSTVAGAGNKDFRYRVQLKFLQTFFTVYCCLLHDGWMQQSWMPPNSV